MGNISRRHIIAGTAAAVASVAAAPVLASISPTSAPSTAEPSDFARALEAFTAAKEDHDRLDMEWRRLYALCEGLENEAKAAHRTFCKVKDSTFTEVISAKVGETIRQSGIEGASQGLRSGETEAAAWADVNNHPDVIAAGEELDRTDAALKKKQDDSGFTALDEVIDDSVCRTMDSCQRLRHSFPGNLSEMMHKLEILALYHSEDVFSFQDMLDICARDLFHLGGRHQLGDESARLKRQWREFDDSPPFDADRSKATWRYIEGRGLVAVVPQ